MFQVPPETPANVLVLKKPVTGQTYSRNVMTFKDMSLSEAGFNVRRATNAAMTQNVTPIQCGGSGQGGMGRHRYLDRHQPTSPRRRLRISTRCRRTSRMPTTGLR